MSSFQNQKKTNFNFFLKKNLLFSCIMQKITIFDRIKMYRRGCNILILELFNTFYNQNNNVMSNHIYNKTFKPGDIFGL